MERLVTAVTQVASWELKNVIYQLGRVVHTLNSSRGGGRQMDLCEFEANLKQSEFQDSHGCIVRPCLENRQNVPVSVEFLNLSVPYSPIKWGYVVFLGLAVSR